MTYLNFSNPFQPMPLSFWIVNILLYSILNASAPLFLFQKVSKIRVPLFIYLVMSILQMFIDSTAIINDVVRWGIAITLLYYFANHRRLPLTKITSFYLYPVAIYYVLTVLIGNIFTHTIHHLDPTMHSWFAQNFDSFVILVAFGVALLFLRLTKKLTAKFFKVVVPYYYVWSWLVALSIFPISFFDYIIIYHKLILPTATIAGVFIGYLVLLILAMWITGKYYYYQADNQLLSNELANLQTYTSYIETLYDDLRRFRHDYKNVLYTLSQSLTNDDPSTAQSLLDSLTDSTQTSIGEKYNAIGRLENVKNSEVKSLLFNKSVEALDKDIKMEIEVEKPFKFNSQINSLDLIRLFSILIDNAINAAEKSTAKRVNISLFEKDHRQYLIVGNSTQNVTINLATLNNIKGQPDSKHGLGLKISE